MFSQKNFKREFNKLIKARRAVENALNTLESAKLEAFGGELVKREIRNNAELALLGLDILEELIDTPDERLKINGCHSKAKVQKPLA